MSFGARVEEGGGLYELYCKQPAGGRPDVFFTLGEAFMSPSLFPSHGVS